MSDANEGTARPVSEKGARLIALAEQLRSLGRERDRVMAMPPYRRTTEGTK